jgi:hypothetical protein
MSDLVERARKFRRFDGDCTCPGLIHEMADRIETLERQLEEPHDVDGDKYCTKCGATNKLGTPRCQSCGGSVFNAAEREAAATTRRGDDAIEIERLKKREHELTAALRHVQTEMNIAVGSFVSARRTAELVLDGEKT